jgi:hypothetical protein
MLLGIQITRVGPETFEQLLAIPNKCSMENVK